MPPKHQREKKRYITFMVHAPRSISRNEFISAIRDNINDSKSWERMKPWLTVFKDNRGILRCTHTSKKEAKALLGSITYIGGDRTEVNVETISTSGTIKKAKENLNAIY